MGGKVVVSLRSGPLSGRPFFRAVLVPPSMLGWWPTASTSIEASMLDQAWAEPKRHLDGLPSRVEI